MPSRLLFVLFIFHNMKVILVILVFSQNTLGENEHKKKAIPIKIILYFNGWVIYLMGKLWFTISRSIFNAVEAFDH